MPAFTLTKSRTFAAPPSAVWEIISDAGRYHEVVDTLAHTEITAGAGEGMVRHCVDTKGREWEETCTLWEPGTRYRMTVDIDSYPASFRAIFKRVEGTWSVAEVDGETHLTLRFDGETKLGPLGRVAVAAMARDSVFASIFDGYERQFRER